MSYKSQPNNHGGGLGWRGTPIWHSKTFLIVDRHRINGNRNPLPSEGGGLPFSSPALAKIISSGWYSRFGNSKNKINKSENFSFTEHKSGVHLARSKEFDKCRHLYEGGGDTPLILSRRFWFRCFWYRPHVTLRKGRNFLLYSIFWHICGDVGKGEKYVLHTVCLLL